MNLKSDGNYVILSNKIDNNLLNKFSGFTILNEMSFDKIKDKLEFFPSKIVVFNECFYTLRKKEIDEIRELLKAQNIKYINITSNIEEVLYADYLMVYDNDELVLNGRVKDVLKEEKKLKKMGFGLPFVVDLSTQLNYYDIFDRIYYDINSLVGDLWN